MENFFGILLVILFLLIVMRPMLQRWVGPMLHRWAMGKWEDNMRRMAGMPTRKEERKARKRARKREKSGAEAFRRAAGGSRTSSRSAGYTGADTLQAYAEDVEFTEVKAFSREVKIGVTESGGKEKIIVEEQIEDAEYIEIKNSEK